ncbi:MAG: hypothetical protein L0Z46_02730 [Nitrospiraceae bacterium]|nr:hypothetical protein [Nitrospiraceae bacterium]
MKPLFWFVLGLIVAFGGQAAAEFVGPYGNSMPNEMTYPVPGGIGYRDSDGTIHYPTPPPLPLQSPC